MKKTLNLLLTALLFLGFAACEKPQTEEETKEPNTENTDKPGPGEDEGNKDDNGEENENEGNENEGNGNNLPKFDFPFFEEFPIECGNLIAEGSEVGKLGTKTVQK